MPGMRLSGTAGMIDWFDDTVEMWGSDVAYLVGTNVEYAVASAAPA